MYRPEVIISMYVIHIVTSRHKPVMVLVCSCMLIGGCHSLLVISVSATDNTMSSSFTRRHWGALDAADLSFHTPHQPAYTARERECLFDQNSTIEVAARLVSDIGGWPERYVPINAGHPDFDQTKTILHRQWLNTGNPSKPRPIWHWANLPLYHNGI